MSIYSFKKTKLQATCKKKVRNIDLIVTIIAVISGTYRSVE